MSFFIRCESKNNEIRILRREDVDLLFFNDLKENNEWHYGLLNKTHYILDSLGKIIGCFNLILLSKYNNKHLFYFDTIEIHKDYRGQGIGTRAVKYIIKIAVKEYENYNIFLLVAKCNQNKLKFFGKLGFVPIKLRKTKLGEHCIMSYPFNEYSGALCQKLFDYFHWREEKKEVISSDCK
ncbi:MAG: GNAT family N-acetyltransferase, partial [Candidatus Lokiarchaeota archaeon]